MRKPVTFPDDFRMRFSERGLETKAVEELYENHDRNSKEDLKFY